MRHKTQQEIFLLSHDCMIIKLNTYNLLTNILFHHGKCVQLLFWLVCFALEKTASALAESVNLRLDPQKSYEGGGFFFPALIFRCEKSQIPVLSIAWEIPVAHFS